MWSFSKRLYGALVALFCLFLLVVGVGWYWSLEPAELEFEGVVLSSLAVDEQQAFVEGAVEGARTTQTLIALVQALLEKPGGYLSNDIFLPGVWLDNMPSWEFGVLVQVRDMARALRKDISRSQSQSTEDANLAIAEPLLHFDNNSWWLPDTEGEYQKGAQALQKYLGDLSSQNRKRAQFYARADNLRSWLADVETRLGSISQRLSASVGKTTFNLDVVTDEELEVRTPWLEIDNVFYEARGSAWALIHLLNAVSVDFKGVLDKKNALVSLKQIVRELEGTQQPVRSFVILNGSGMGMLANHSLVMASYISRANAAIIDLRELLSQG